MFMLCYISERLAFFQFEDNFEAFKNPVKCAERGLSGGPCKSGGPCEEWRIEIYKQYQHAVVMKKAMYLGICHRIEQILWDKAIKENKKPRSEQRP